MKKMFFLIGALVALVIGGCGGMPKVPGVDPSRPLVTRGIQDDGRKTADVRPNPLSFPAGQGAVTIVWSFPPSGNLRFAENGIVIEGEIINPGAQTTDRTTNGASINREQNEIVNCRIAKEGLEFTCLNRHTRPGMFKYAIRVLQDGTPLAPLDPVVANN